MPGLGGRAPGGRRRPRREQLAEDAPRFSRRLSPDPTPDPSSEPLEQEPGAIDISCFPLGSWRRSRWESLSLHPTTPSSLGSDGKHGVRSG